MTAIAVRLGLRSRQHLWAACRRPVVKAVTRECLALAQAELPPNSPQFTQNFRAIVPGTGQRPVHRPWGRNRCGMAREGCVSPRFF